METILEILTDSSISLLAGTITAILLSLLIKKLTDFQITRTNLQIGDKTIRFSPDLNLTLEDIRSSLYDIEEKPKIFLSYSYEDKDFVNSLRQDLVRHGIETWLDSVQIKPGEPILERLQEGISNSNWVILIVPRKFSEESWVRKELELALNQDHLRDFHRIVPILLSDRSIPKELANRQYLSFKNDYKSALDTLVKTIKPSMSENRQEISPMPITGF